MLEETIKLRDLVLWAVLLSFVSVLNAGAANPIQQENAKLGTSDWNVTNYAAAHEIEGYASLTGVNRGGQIQFFVNTVDRQFTIEIFRTGWYGGTGARRMTSAVTLSGTAQPACSNDQVTGLIECAWKNPYTFQIPNNTADPTDWASGVYLAKLTAASSGKGSYIVFVVRDDVRSSDYLFQSAVDTYQAYNNWGGRSLYAYNSDFQARKVSFNRPYLDSRGAGQYLGSWEYPAVRFLEREGYDVTYATDVDVHENANLLLSHKADLIFGHSEYWTWEIRKNVIAARDNGVSLGIFAANNCYWQVRYEPSAAGAADRTMVGYKNFALTQDPYYTGGNTSLYHLVTTNFRATPVNLPEDAFIGVMYGNVVTTGDIVVANASNWVFSSTGLQNGSHLVGLMGDEVDGLAGNTPPGTVLLSHSPYLLSGSTTTHYADMTVYTAPSGATVFAAGTIIWSRGLDSFGGGTVNPAAQQITRNVLARFTSNSSSLSLSSVALNPTSLIAGASTAGTVTLTAPAPSAGATVVLTSDNSAIVQVPPSVIVPAGATSATFIATTSSVASVTNVTITGNYNLARTAILTVKPTSNVTISSVSVSPTTVMAGTSATGTVTLNGLAPDGGATVSLKSSNTAVVQVNSTITVNGGEVSAFFPVTTKVVSSTVAVVITASYNGGSQQTTLTVNPNSGAVTFSPGSLTFSTQAVGTTSSLQNVTLTNSGRSPLKIKGISIAGAGAENFQTGVINCGTSLAAGASCTVPVTFAPVAAGLLTAALSVSDDAPGTPHTMSLAGTGAGLLLTCPANQCSQATSAGQTVTYGVQLVPQSFSGNAAISCSGAPVGATCLVSPGSVAVSGDKPAAVTVTVKTTPRSASGFPLHMRFRFDRTLWILPLALVLLVWFAFAFHSNRLQPSFALLLLLLVASIGCAGTTETNSSGGGATANGTPAGTSTLTITAVSGSTQATLPLTLTVN